LRFYECRIALDRAGVIEELRAGRRQNVLEIGAGWGGFAHQLKTMFPNVTNRQALTNSQLRTPNSPLPNSCGEDLGVGELEVGDWELGIGSWES
jgi:hypothetical protein